MTGHDLYAALLAERYGPTRTPTPPTDVDHPSVQAIRRAVLVEACDGYRRPHGKGPARRRLPADARPDTSREAWAAEMLDWRAA